MTEGKLSENVHCQGIALLDVVAGSVRNNSLAYIKSISPSLERMSLSIEYSSQ